MTGSGFIALIVVVSIMALIGYLLSRLSIPPVQSARNATPEKLQADDKQATPTDLPKPESSTSEETSELPLAQLVEEVNRRLPQTQCAQCGHPGCRPYAEAIIRDNAPINQCPPGGTALIEELAVLLGTDALPLDNDKGQTKPPQVAVIVEPDCIGCVLCIAACPVDAIVGAARYMHTVIADQCTGCELCLPPCPVDCIELHPLETPLHRWQWPKPS